jgi:DNA invertase Pin-like site-specific DNA recombinase
MGVYADEALTGTKDERPEFRRLLADCEAGNIDMVITKSVSRFARNTVTLLETVRKLKARGIDVFFEKENIHSMSGDGELMLAILASFAQEESRSVSENCKWRVRKQFEQGVSVTTQLLGYRGRNGTFEIIPEEAQTVRMIFDDYVSGMGRNAIMKKLLDLKIPTKSGGTWSESQVADILRNEKYVGDLILQKYYRTDHLTKLDRRNYGELQRYYVRDHHEAIIDRLTFERVQAGLRERAQLFHPYEYRSTDYPFSGMIVCGNCGKVYRRKICHGKVAWNCATYMQLGKSHCHSKQIPEEILIETTASVLGLEEFDAAAFKERIRKIRVPSFNHLIYEFMDGTLVERVWQDRTRRESWNEDMRRQAAENTKRRWSK